MVKRIGEVLASNELERIEELQRDMRDYHLGTILDNVLHIECNADGQKITVKTYESAAGVYSYMLFLEEEKRKRPTETELRKIRAEYIRKEGKRESIVRNETRLRNQELIRHKWLLSEREGYDVGIPVSFGHWLKGYSDDFYAESERHHSEEGLPLRLFGMERAIVIGAPNKEGRKSHYVLVRRKDLLGEESFAQYQAGIASGKDSASKAKTARRKLTELHETEHFCILD